VGGLMDVKALLRTADSNQNYISYLQKRVSIRGFVISKNRHFLLCFENAIVVDSAVHC
jgi:hypothetical protein